MEISLKEKDRIINEEQIKNKKLNNILKNLEDLVKQFKTYILSPGEDFISIKIVSADQIVKFSTIAKFNDKFTKIENILYDNFPEYKETENFFLANGIKVNKYKKIEENNIKNNDVLTLNIIENE